MSEIMITATVPGHGTYVAPAELVTWAVIKYLPASTAELRAIVEDRGGIDCGDITDITTFLVILAEWEDGTRRNESEALARTEDAR